MRSERVFAALSEMTSGDSAYFLQVLDLKGERFLLFGQVEKIIDYHKRPGIIGACVSFTQANRECAIQSISYLNELFRKIKYETLNRWSGRPLPERLNLLDDVQQHETPSDCIFKNEIDLRHIAEGCTLNQTILNTCFDFIEASEQIGRVLVLSVATNVSKPADQVFITSTRDAVHKARAAQMDYYSIPRRMDQIEQRLNLHEKDLNIIRHELQTKTVSIHSFFIRWRMALPHWHLIALATSVILFLALVAAVGIFLFRQSEKDTDISGSSNPSSVLSPNLGKNEEKSNKIHCDDTVGILESDNCFEPNQ